MSVTISEKQLQAIIKKQRTTDVEISFLKEIVSDLAKDEINPFIAKRLAAQSCLMDSGKGKRFSTAAAFRAYARGL